MTSDRTSARVFSVIRPVFIAGRRNASAAEQRRPSRALICQVPTPRWLAPLKSGLYGSPIPCAARMKARVSSQV